ncbi:hypothetical protein AAMO2058_000643600 [Amorphochlora amoebiformis]|mmetsp:Transcript_21989/g.34620  ORF Transcript_21989/g.34620 Transcript_21989/m.34620 type:complete len:267 (-) Transcript_21989:950-1750(-)
MHSTGVHWNAVLPQNLASAAWPAPSNHVEHKKLIEERVQGRRNAYRSSRRADRKTEVYVRSQGVDDVDLAAFLARIRSSRKREDMIGAAPEREQQSEEDKAADWALTANMDDLVAICCLQDLSRSLPKEETEESPPEFHERSVKPQPPPIDIPERSTSPNRRSRVPMACTRCKLAHTRCDTKRPCGRCVRRGDVCVDAVPKRRGRKRSEDSDYSGESTRSVRMRRTSMAGRGGSGSGSREPRFAHPSGSLEDYSSEESSRSSMMSS